jgi:hypothetical protein
VVGGSDEGQPEKVTFGIGFMNSRDPKKAGKSRGDKRKRLAETRTSLLLQAKAKRKLANRRKRQRENG